jgi:PKD repeat protein
MNNLSCGTTYSERVRVWDSAGLASNWSSYVSYTTPPLNRPPTAYNLQVSQPGNYCSMGPHASFSWYYADLDGDSENSWQIQVDNNSDFSSPAADSGRVYSTSNAYSTTNLSYNTTYYWRVQVWDSRGMVSSWASGPSFAPPRHSYPTVNFNWSPTAPSANENVLFSDQSIVYGGTSKSAWSWTFQSGSPGTSSQQNPTVKFTSEGNKQISLTVTDSDGYACTGYKQVYVNLPLPKWKEITPH